MRNRLPAMAMANGLQLKSIEESCHLTELENNLIAQNINFLYIFCMQKSRWAVQATVQQLTRTPRDAGLIPVQLKRKLEYNGNHKKEYIDPEKIFRALRCFKKCGNPHYQFFDDLESYQNRCNEEDKQGHDLLFGAQDKSKTIQDNGELVSEEEDRTEES